MNDCKIQVEWNEEEQLFVASINAFNDLQNLKTTSKVSFRAQLQLAELLEITEDRQLIPLLIGLIKDNEHPIFKEIGLSGLDKFFFYRNNEEDKTLIKSFLEEYVLEVECEIIKEIIKDMLEYYEELND